MKRRLLVALAGLVVLAGIGYGVHAWIYSIRHATPDDAYVETIIVPLAAKVAGHVALMRVDDNQSVKAGDLLLRIDPRDYEAKRDQARAAVAVAAASFQSARSDADLARETTRAQADEARAVLEGARVAERSSEAAVEETKAKVEAKRAAMAAMSSDVAGGQSPSEQAPEGKNARARPTRAAQRGAQAFGE